MPRTASWLKKLDQIKTRVEASTTFAFDRAAIAKLFQISQRQAANVLETIGGERIGGAFIVPRARLVAYLNGTEEADAASNERDRRTALALKLAEFRAAGPPLVAVLPAPSSPGTSLPAGVMVTGPGRLEIAYDSPEAVLGVIFALAELSDVDPVGFVDSLKYRSSEGAEEEEEE